MGNTPHASGSGKQAGIGISVLRHISLPALIILGCLSLLTSCLPTGQQSTYSSPQYGTASPPPERSAGLPKIDIMPPAKFTKGAPAYTMLFHTLGSSMPGATNEQNIVRLRMISHPGPADGAPKAYHMIPTGMRMGEYLPLVQPVRESSSYVSGGEHKPEKMIIKTYWGCSETVRPGQPRVMDTGKMMQDMPDMSTQQGQTIHYGRSGSDLKPGWVDVEWPNKDDTRLVPKGASLVGDHFVHGNFLPHIKFSMGSGHDLMAGLNASAQSQSLQDTIPITWRKAPTALGYHVMATAYNDARKEIIIWTSSETPDINVASQFLSTPQVRKYISQKVILPADRDRCYIPKGIFAGADVVMVTVSAWGDDYWASYPARPANAPKEWKPDWVVKGQFLSTDSLMLGAHARTGGGSTYRPADESENTGSHPASNPEPAPQPSGGSSILGVLRGIF